MQSHSDLARFTALQGLPQFQPVPPGAPVVDAQWGRAKAASTAAARSKSAESRAGFTYAEMIRAAITSSKSGQMFLFQIYEYLQTHFGCFRNATDQNWKNSVRHSLSINPLFKRVDPPGPVLPGTKRKATAGLWSMRTTVEPARVTPVKRKFEDELLGGGSGCGSATSPVPASPAPTPSPTCSMADRDVAEMLMALAAGSYCGAGSASPTLH